MGKDYSGPIDNAYLRQILGHPFLRERAENNQWLVTHRYGDDITASRHFNVKVYINGKRQLKMTTSDKGTLERILGKVPNLPVGEVIDSSIMPRRR